ncbi:LysR family transcriptional regulator [Peterkaempfera bronchialis]|uniref:LysR family transcriptional regulator n=1 Tax=Peterkaempfera bronchialis TaxID=2126346 RepID=UPI0013B453AF|nr:LysR family transcriptional regulator [Peterkaempfera bronchialis]
MIERLTGTHPRFLAPPMNLTGAPVHVYERTGLRLQADLSKHLDWQATGLLHKAGISEPVRWEPLPEWFVIPHSQSPGPDLDSIPADQLWPAVQSRAGVKAIAEQLQVSVEHVRAFAERHPLPPETAPTQRWPKIPRAQTPTTKELQELVGQGLSNRRIGAVLGYNRTFVRRLLGERGLSPALASGGQRTIHIDPDWLRHEYEVKQRTYKAIAASIGVSTCTIRGRAAEAGIPSRRSARDHPLAKFGGPADFPPVLWNSFAGYGAELRAQRFLLIIELPTSTITAAARALSISACRVAVFMAELERVAEAWLFNRTNRGRTTRPTPAGTRFADDIREAIALIERPSQRKLA